MKALVSMRRQALTFGALAVAACGFSPTAPFSGFDGQGTRLSGSFEGTATASSGVSAQAASLQGLRVAVQGRPSLATSVSQGGRFELVGLPSGSWSLVFTREERPAGEIRFTSVRRNQGIRIVVTDLDGEVVLLSESRDRVSFGDECPRGAGFWCQNQSGRNPNLSAEEFARFSEEAARSLAGVPPLDTAEEIAAAVCDTGDQLLRQLATLALNLAAETLSRSTTLSGEPFSDVGAAFDAAAALAKDPGSSREERNRVKDLLERINENENTGVCPSGEDDDDVGEEPPATGSMTICHIPPGNPSAKHTIQIDASAWPAHKAHGDAQGPCS